MNRLPITIRPIAMLLCALILALPAVPRAQETISIGKSDFLIEKDEILADAKRLIGEAELGVDSMDYARSYNAFRQKVAKADPPLTAWKESEQAVVSKVPEPSSIAKKRLAEHQESLLQQERERGAESDAMAAARRRNNLQEQRLDAIREREETAAELRRRELELIEDRYYNYNRGYYHHVYPVRPIRPVRPGVTPSPTPNYGASGLAPR